MRAGTYVFPEISVSDFVSSWKEDLTEDPPVLLVGSPISQYAPTRLPAGATVCEQLFELLFPEDSFAWLRDDFREIPFEGVMEAYPHQSSLPAIIAAQYSNSNAPPNALHHVLAKALASRRIAALITTNYDCAIEASLSSQPGDVDVAYDDEGCKSVLGSPASFRPLYFKIHGTADPNSTRALSSLVFRLRQEGRLRQSKRALLSQVIRSRRLMVLYYSGRDWEICPETARGTAPRGMWWFRRGCRPQDQELSPHALMVLKQHKGVVVVGDVQDLIRDLFDPAMPACERTNAAQNIATRFSEAVIQEWRIHILDRLACPSVGLPLISKLPSPLCVGIQIAASNMLAHEGKYKQAAREAQRLADVAAMDGPQRRALLLLAAERWLGYGAPVRRIALVVRSLLPFRRRLQEELVSRGTAYRLALTLVRKVDEVLRAAKLGVVAMLLNKLERSLYRRAVDSLEDEGAWDERQWVQDEAERLGVADPARPPLLSINGNDALGHQGRKSDRQRRHFSILTPSELTREAEKIRAAIAKAEKYGWHHEAWKHIATLYRRIPSERNGTSYIRWWHHFRQTEYPWFRRLMLAAPIVACELARRIRRGTIPSEAA